MLGMSTYRLAERMELSQGRVTQIEAAERRGAVTLNTLKQAADAMDCQLIYAIVPKTSLQDILKNQAIRVAQEEIEAVSHTMALEDQAIDPKEKEKQRQDLVEELLDGPVKKLWNTKS